MSMFQENSVADLELKTIRQRYEHLQAIVKEQATTAASDDSKQTQLQGTFIAGFTTVPFVDSQPLAELERRIVEEQARSQSIELQLAEVERQRSVLSVECAHLRDQLRQQEHEYRNQVDKVRITSLLTMTWGCDASVPCTEVLRASSL